MLSELRTSYEELQDNFQLLAAIQDLYMKDWNLPFNSPQTHKKIKIILRNFSRQLHSYLASFDSFYEHLKATKSVIKNDDGNFAKDFDQQATTLLTEKSLFIIQLRNFTLHRKLPMAGVGMSFLFTPEGRKVGKDCGIIKSLPSLQVSDLRSYTKWWPSSEKILKASRDKIEILRYVADANNEIEKLYIWCDNRIHKII